VKNDHGQVEDLLPFYAAGTTKGSEQGKVEAHLPGCPACQRRLQEWREIGRNVQTVMAAYQRQVELPPLKIPARTPAAASALPTHKDAYRETDATLLQKLTAFLRRQPDPVEKGNYFMKGYSTHESDSFLTHPTPKHRGFYRALVSGLITASLVAVLVLVVAVGNRPDSPATNTNQNQGQPGAASTKAVPIATATIQSTVGVTPNPVSFGGKLVSTITFNPNAGADPAVPEKPGHTNVAASPDGKLVAISEEGAVKLFKTADGSVIKEVEVPEQYKSSVIWALLAWSPDSQTLAVSYYYQQNAGPEGRTGQVQFWTAAGELKTSLAGLSNEVDIINWSPDGNYFLTSSHKYNGQNDRFNLQLWDKNGQPLQTLMQNATVPPIRIAWSPDSQLIAATVENGNVAGPLSLQLWQPDGKLAGAYTDLPKNSANGLAWSPDSRSLAVGLAAPSDNLWVFNRQQLLAGAAKPYVTLPGHSDMVIKVDWSADSKTLASSSVDNTVRLWDVAAGKETATFKVGKFSESGVAWSPDGNLLAIAANGFNIQVVDKSGKTVTTLKETGQVNYLQWSSDGETLLSTLDGGTLHTWQR
jgi:WD40 repeat protein